MIFTEKRPKASYIASVFTYLFICAALFFSWVTLKPSSDAYTDPDPTKFSQTRAFEHLAHISSEPHFTGSQAHEQVRNYLIDQLNAMGLKVEVQDSLATGTNWYVSSKVKNIVARLSATEGSSELPGSALALMSHYDSSTYSSFGASDAGSGVVTILEGLRAFTEKGENYTNDILVIFTDAEEQGLLGAEAFVNHHRWASDVGLVLNFEARGSGGPSYMLLETNSGNHALIEAFSNAGVNYPLANSLMYSIYKRLPNDTDLTVFREEKNINGFNFAFIDDHFDYHTAQDTAERLDPATLNHQGDYLTALLPFFANADLPSLNNEQDDVFFNFANLTVVQYSFALAWPLFGICLVLFIYLAYQNMAQGQCSVKSLMVGSLPGLFTLGLTVILGIYGWKILTLVSPQYLDIRHGFTYNGHALLGAFILFSISFSFVCYQWFKNRYSYLNTVSFSLFPALIWLIINGLACAFLTGASFFVIPLIGFLVALVHCSVSGNSWQNYPVVAALLLSPGLIIIAPQIPTLVVGLGLSSLVLATVLTALLAMLLLPGMLLVRGSQYLSKVCFVVALGLLVYSQSQAHYTSDRKKPTSVNYVYDAESNQSYLFSYNQTLDGFTEQFFQSTDINSDQLAHIYPGYRRTKINFVRKTAPLDIDLADVSLSTDKTNNGTHTLTIKVSPNRQNNMLQLVTFSPLTVHKLSINGEEFKRRGNSVSRGNLLRHVVTDNSPIEVTMKVTFEGEANLRLIETRFDLPKVLTDFIPRQSEFMPEPFVYTDATILSQRIHLSR